ncbi:hypothetical protein PF010_g14237 [Phytophthora fragariae]|uniref:Uncharacterized protein n=1 Tax=Phytophthora fragariae TaxID=53985 RepID=A0A6G0KXH1_9STRA|nr:hypothetical protein PF010_g14237 [Phytophthora fragariae]
MIESSIAVATLHSDSDAEGNSEDELDSVDASGSEDLMAAFDQAAEESQSLLNRMPPAPIDTSPSNNTAQSSPNEMPLAPDRMPLTPTNTPPITNSAPLTPQAVSQAVAPALVATSRAGMAPSELAALSKQLSQTQLKRNATSAGVLSQTAQRRRRIDAAIDKASNEMTTDNFSEFSSTIVAMMFMMEERQAARDAEYQRQKEEREREQVEREEKRAAEREMREQQSQQLMLMLMTKLMGVRNNN